MFLNPIKNPELPDNSICNKESTMAKQLGGIYYVHDRHWVLDQAGMTADLLKAKRYGFNFVMLSCWQEQQDRIAMAFNAATAANIKIGLFLEDPTLPVKLRAQFANRLLDLYGDHPKIFKYHGKPLLVVYQPAWAGTIPLWQPELVSLKQRATMVCDNLRPEWVKEFDGCYNYNVGTLIQGQTEADYTKLKNFYKQVHDTAALAGKFFIPTVMAKFDDSAFRNPFIKLDERNGELLARTWEAVFATGSDLALVTSLNELAENSNVLHNNRYLELNRDLKSFWLNLNALWVNPINQSMPS